MIYLQLSIAAALVVLFVWGDLFVGPDNYSVVTWLSIIIAFGAFWLILIIRIIRLFVRKK